MSYSADPELDAQRHTDAQAEREEFMRAAEISHASEMRTELAKCDPDSTALGKTKTQIVNSDWPYRSRPEFLHETVTDLMSSYSGLSCQVVRALMLSAKAGHFEAKQACEAIAVQFGIENAGNDV